MLSDHVAQCCKAVAASRGASGLETLTRELQAQPRGYVHVVFLERCAIGHCRGACRALDTFVEFVKFPLWVLVQRPTTPEATRAACLRAMAQLYARCTFTPAEVRGGGGESPQYAAFFLKKKIFFFTSNNARLWCVHSLTRRCYWTAQPVADRSTAMF